jgi:prepilin-type N-terminal cleavage/methylation domain-containing protein
LRLVRHHHDQRGMTLVEVLVACAMVGIGLSFMTGSFSTAVIGARIAHNSAVNQAISAYEQGRIRSAPYNPSASPYSDCFAIDSSRAPVPAPSPTSYRGGCQPFATFRADVNPTPGPTSNLLQWTVTINSWPNPNPLASPLSFYRDNR